MYSWWLSYGISGNRDKCINMMKTLSPDMLVISNIDLTQGAGNIADEAAAYGYSFYNFAPFTNDNLTTGTMLLSKYPVAEIETIVSPDRNYKHLQVTLNYDVVDFYYGGNDDGNNWDATALTAKVKEQYNATKAPFIAAIKGE